MRDKLSIILALAFSVLILSIPLLAHHGNAAFDAGKTITVKGTVTDWFWANPHCLISLDAKDDQGQMVHWVVETSAPPSMINAGWTKQTVTVGDQVTITMQAVKSGRNVGRVVEIVLPSGQKLNGGFGSQPSPGSDQGAGNSGGRY